jgi:hypothetical protein
MFNQATSVDDAEETPRLLARSHKEGANKTLEWLIGRSDAERQTRTKEPRSDGL